MLSYEISWELFYVTIPFHLFACIPKFPFNEILFIWNVVLYSIRAYGTVRYVTVRYVPIRYGTAGHLIFRRFRSCTLPFLLQDNASSKKNPTSSSSSRSASVEKTAKEQTVSFFSKFSAVDSPFWRIWSEFGSDQCEFQIWIRQQKGWRSPYR